MLILAGWGLLGGSIFGVAIEAIREYTLLRILLVLLYDTRFPEKSVQI